MMEETARKYVSYAHKDGAGARYVQDAADPLPKWAVDVRPYEYPEESAAPDQKTKPAKGTSA